jgi:chromodomain-containing protein
MKASHDHHVRPSTSYAIGEKVYLESTNLRTDRPCKKLDDKRHGPFKVKQKVGPASYKLQLPACWPALYPVFNEQYLSPYQSPCYPSQQKLPPPPPLVIEGEPEYDVEEIRGSRRRHGKLQYLVHWKGYPREEDTWEPEENVIHAKEKVEKFHHRNLLRPSLTNNVRAITKPDLSDP